MEKLCLSSTPSPTIPRPFLSLPLSLTRGRRKVFYPLKNPKKLSVFASKDNDNNKLNQWDLMELKFGQMLGEDPKLTLAKIMGRKANPDASYIEIEKNFYKNKGKLVEVKEVPFDVPEKRGSAKATDGLNLVKPVPRKGIKAGGGEENSELPEIKRPNDSVKNKIGSVTKSSVPNVILRKPSVFSENDNEMDSSSRLRIKPNLSLSMRTEPVKEKFSGMTLLKKPEQFYKEVDHGGKNENNLMNDSGRHGAVNACQDDVANGGQQDNVEEFPQLESDLVSEQLQLGEGSQTGKEIGMRMSESPTVGWAASEFPVESVLQGRPKRSDQSTKEIPVQEGTLSMRPESFDGVSEQKPPLSWPQKEIEETDWTRVEQRFNLGDRVEVELISCSPRGFVVSFGSLIGFLPYRNLAAKWKFLAFESWLRRNGLDPSKYRQNLGIIGNDEVQNKGISLEPSLSPEVGQTGELVVTVTDNMDLEDLLKVYDQEKIQYLSSYVGQRIKVNILLADRKSRKLIFSMRPKEKEETVEKKRSLMAKLAVGDVVKCCIKKITYFGIFVEVEGVPALIHQTEVSWDTTLDSTSYLKIGQIVEAKVHQLDFALERIFLSLKEITPDPLSEALECIVGNNSLSGALEAAQADAEWVEVDLLIKELQEIDGVQAVTKGRYFLSPGLAPTFQVYMASMFENQYKLLARSGNKVQEVMVQASIDREEMKSAVLKCTNRVEI